jgi:hypothetical protein
MTSINRELFENGVTNNNDNNSNDADETHMNNSAVSMEEQATLEYKKQMEHFEIEIIHNDNENENEKNKNFIPVIASVPSEDTMDEQVDEIQSLLRETTTDDKQQQNDNENDDLRRHGSLHSQSSSSGILLRHGNLRIVSPWIYTHTGGWGVIGPHWFGPPCVMAILLYATYFFGISRSYYDLHRPVSTALCGIACLCTMFHLLNASYRDPGIIVPGRYVVPNPVPRNYRWCEICQYYQPPSAAHCPECNVCIAGYDHHCVWMGTCIGVGNFKPFMRFNLSWLTYFMFAILWITIMAPLYDRLHHHQQQSTAIPNNNYTTFITNNTTPQETNITSNNNNNNESHH